MITLTINYPLVPGPKYDEPYIETKPSEEFKFEGVSEAVIYLADHEGWSSYVITGTSL